MGHTWGRQSPGGPHVGPMNFALRVSYDPFGAKTFADPIKI